MNRQLPIYEKRKCAPVRKQRLHESGGEQSAYEWSYAQGEETYGE